MRRQSKTESIVNPEQSARHVIAAGVKALQALSIVTIALFVFVGAAHAQGPCPPNTPNCILVSSEDGQVHVWSDDGTTSYTKTLLNGGGGGGEGIACVSGSTNVLYVANNGGDISAYSMNLVGGQATYLNKAPGCGHINSGLVADGSGMLLYQSGSGTPGCVSSMNISPGPPYLTLNSGQNTTDRYAHDITIGNCAPGTSCGYGGMVLTTDYYDGPPYVVNEYSPNPNLNAPLPFVGLFLPTAPNNCANFAGVGTACWTDLSGMAFDASGNLWANDLGVSNPKGFQGTFEFAPGGSCGAAVCPLNFVYDVDSKGGGPVGITVAPATDQDNPGKVLVANFVKGDVAIIDTTQCTGLNPPGSPWTPGTCPEKVFFADDGPKYVVYNKGCANPDNNGYVEICKQGDPNYPPPNQIYDFTVTAPLFSTGTIQVPLGECSGPLHVPGATAPNSVTITEAPVVGVLVDNVTAYSYDGQGFKIPELDKWTEPDLFATVYVEPGDVAQETLATFTNYAAQPGQLKLCKIAGDQGTENVLFTFTVTAGSNQNIYMIEAGPPDQGGFCELAGTFPPNTPVTIAETPLMGYTPSNITVSQGQLTACQPPSIYCRVASIGAGITEVDFTNVTSSQKRCLGCSIVQP